MLRQKGASYIEWIIGGTILVMMTFSVIDFLLGYAARSAIHRGAQDALAVAISNPNIASIAPDNLTRIFDAVDQEGRDFPSSLFVGTVDNPRGLANLILNQDNRAFSLLRPTPSSGQTLMNTLQEQPIGIEVSYQRKPLFGSITFGLLGNNLVTETVRVYGYAELPPIPAVNRAQVCILDEKDQTSPGGTRGNQGEACATDYCNGKDSQGKPRCPAGEGRCYLDGLECIPCGEGFNPNHWDKTCDCGLNCNSVTWGQNATYFIPDTDCKNCICDAPRLTATCLGLQGDQPGRSCRSVPDFATCKCTPAANCSMSFCETQGSNPNRCQCKLTLQECQAQVGSPTAGLDWGNCSCIDCGWGSRGGIPDQNGFCTCAPKDPPCGQGQYQAWWRNNFCACACNHGAGWEKDLEASEEQGTLVCKCKANHTPNGNVCKCNLTNTLCGAGRTVDQYDCKCVCNASGYTSNNGVCTHNSCLPANCPNRRNIQTDPVSGAIVSCECGGGH